MAITGDHPPPHCHDPGCWFIRQLPCACRIKTFRRTLSLVIDFCAARLPHYKCPNKVWFVDEVPRGITGKVRRYELRESSAAG